MRSKLGFTLAASLLLAAALPALPGTTALAGLCRSADTMAWEYNPNAQRVEVTGVLTGEDLVIPANQVWLARSDVTLVATESITIDGALFGQGLLDAPARLILQAPRIQINGAVATESGWKMSPLVPDDSRPTDGAGVTRAEDGGDVFLLGATQIGPFGCLGTGSGDDGQDESRSCLGNLPEGSRDLDTLVFRGDDGGNGGSLYFAVPPILESGSRLHLGNGGDGGSLVVSGTDWRFAHVQAEGGRGGSSGFLYVLDAPGGVDAHPNPLVYDHQALPQHVEDGSGNGGKGGDAALDLSKEEPSECRSETNESCVDELMNNGTVCPQHGPDGKDVSGGPSTYCVGGANGNDGSPGETSRDGDGGNGNPGTDSPQGGGSGTARGGPGGYGLHNGGDGGSASATGAPGCKGGDGGNGGDATTYVTLGPCPGSCWLETRWGAGGHGGNGGTGSRGGKAEAIGGDGGGCVFGENGDGGDSFPSPGRGGNGGDGGDGGDSGQYPGAGGEGGSAAGNGDVGISGPGMPGTAPASCSPGSAGTFSPILPPPAEEGADGKDGSIIS